MAVLELIKESTETFIDSNGCSTGDYSVGSELSRSYTFEAVEEDGNISYVTVTVTAYITALLEGRELPFYEFAEIPENVVYKWNTMTEVIQHEDADEVGGTEITSEYYYESFTEAETVEDAEKAAKEALSKTDIDDMQELAEGII